MKKLFVTLLIFVVAATTVTSQSVEKAFAHLLINEINGFIFLEDYDVTDDGQKMESLAFKIEESYSFDLLRLKVKYLIDEYSNARISVPWTWKEGDPDKYVVYIKLSDIDTPGIVYLTYIPTQGIGVIVYFIK